MPYISTEWDYDLKTEVFKVNGDKGYTHETDTLLTEITHETSGETPPYRDNSKMQYFTADFTVDVKRDLSNSQVAFYDNGQAIPAYIGEDKYMTIPWGLNTPPTTVSLALGYDVEHKIYAKYLGNKKALPSKSQTLTLTEPMPNLFSTKIERTTTRIQFPKEFHILLPIRFTIGTSSDTARVREIKLYDGTETELQTIEVTIPANSTVGEGTFNLENGLEEGLHHLVMEFEGDEYNESSKIEFDISVGYKLLITEHSPVFSVTNEFTSEFHPPFYYYGANYVKCRITDYFDRPLSRAMIGINDSKGTPYGKVLSNNEGEATVHLPISDDVGGSITAVAVVFPEELFDPARSYFSESIPISVIKVNEIMVTPPSTVTAENNTFLTEVRITKHQWLHNAKNTLADIPITYYNHSKEETVPNPFQGTCYTNSDGVAEFAYVGTSAGKSTMYVKCGYATLNSFPFHDATQFWGVSLPSLNKEYTHIRDGKMIEVANGYKFQSVVGTGIAWIGVGDGGDYENDWELVYYITKASTKLQIACGTWKYIDGNPKRTSLVLSKAVNLRRKDRIVITYEKSTKTITIKTPYNTISKPVERNGFPAFGMKSTVNAYMIVTNVRFTRW